MGEGGVTWFNSLSLTDVEIRIVYHSGVLWPSENNDEKFMVLLTDSAAYMLKAGASLKFVDSAEGPSEANKEGAGLACSVRVTSSSLAPHTLWVPYYVAYRTGARYPLYDHYQGDYQHDK
uniref:Uncharacterized protein n=1 Tax=Timema cristinae TaxID=61476 RepID=A0A7R9H2T6_TIMCR|nr:unnamed protein product [Timema cristinae]